MNLSYDPNDPLQHIGEALGLLLVAIAQEHDNPLGLLDATQRAVQKCEEHPEMFAPQTKALVRYASKSPEGAIQAAIDRTQPN